MGTACGSGALAAIPGSHRTHCATGLIAAGAPLPQRRNSRSQNRCGLSKRWLTHAKRRWSRWSNPGSSPQAAQGRTVPRQTTEYATGMANRNDIHGSAGSQPRWLGQSCPLWQYGRLEERHTERGSGGSAAISRSPRGIANTASVFEV